MENVSAPPPASTMSERADTPMAAAFGTSSIPQESQQAYMQARKARYNALNAIATTLGTPGAARRRIDEAAATSDSRLPVTPSATAAELAASSIIPAAPQTALKADIARIPTAIFNTVLPPNVRQGWRMLFTYLASFPGIGIAFLIIMLIATEVERPGFFPRPMGLTNGIVGALCAGAIVFGVVAFMDWSESGKWMWQEDGWVWPWERLLWGASVGEFDGAASTWTTPGLRRRGIMDRGILNAFCTPSTTVPNAPANTPAAVGRDVVPNPGQITAALLGLGSTFTASPAITKRNMARSSGMTTARPSPARPGSNSKPAASSLRAATEQPFLIPPTPFLPRGLRPIHLPPPTPAQIHQSGLLGESPQASRFKHFSGEGFARTSDMLRVSEQWSKPAGETLDELWEGVRLDRSKLVDVEEEGEGEGVSGMMEGAVDVGSTLIEVEEESEVGVSSANSATSA